MQSNTQITDSFTKSTHQFHWSMCNVISWFYEECSIFSFFNICKLKVHIVWMVIFFHHHEIRKNNITNHTVSVKLYTCYTWYKKKLLQSAAVHIILQIGKNFIVRFCIDLVSAWPTLAGIHWLYFYPPNNCYTILLHSHKCFLFTWWWFDKVDPSHLVLVQDILVPRKLFL